MDELQKVHESTLAQLTERGLLLKVLALETESKENTQRLHAKKLKKSKEIDTLQNERTKLEQHADSLDKEVIQL
ncbi:hypothetical protein JHK82_047811 [Glycine max]|nr:hypothetical protein JHK82_047811 [Glycine max]